MARLWIDTRVGITSGSGATQHQSLMSGFTQPNTRLQGMTLLRTIIGLDMGALVHDAGEGSQQVALGIAIASEDAFAAGIGSLPQPEDPLAHPRLAWVFRMQYRVFGFAADQPAVFTRRIDLDIRAQRKLENGVGFIIVNNTAQEGVAFTTFLSGFVRQLWLVS